MNDEYTPTPDETINTLWPESEFRPIAAWKHSRCGLIVTNRADHDDQYGEFRCPEWRQR